MFHINLHVTGNQFRLEEPSPDGGIRVTWYGVQSAALSLGISGFSVELLPNGNVHLAYGARLSTGGGQNNDAIVGFLSLALLSEPAGLPLSGFGLPDCQSHLDLSQVLFSVLLANPGNSDMRWAWSAPANALGLQVYLQAGVFGPTPNNPVGMTLPHGLCASIGL